MKDFPWLTAIGVTPLIGGLVVSMLPRTRLPLAKQLAIAFSLLSLALTVGMITQFETGATEQFQLVEQHQWIEAFGIQYKVGVDGLALVLIALTAFLVPVVLLASWNVDNKAKSYFALILLLETAMIGVFAAIDVFLFYALFEVMLVPMYFLTRDAAGAGTFDYEQWLTLDVARNTQRWLFLGFFVAFAVKVPLFPFHTWLPDAHTEAPTGGSVLLAAVMLKIGTFGFMRYSIPLFPEASRYFAPMMMGLGLFGIFYGALVAIVQKDIKRLVAYTSIAHLGFIILGTFAFTRQGQSGAVLYMVNHGLSTGALFLIIGFLYERRHTRLIEEYGGLRSVVPVLAATFLIAGLSSLALPGLNGFVSEFLVLLGTYSRHPVLGIIATFGIILAALYILIAYQRTMQGPLTVEANRGMADLDLREKLVIAPVLLVIIVLGVYPAPVLRVIEPSVQRVMERVDKTDPAPTIESATGEQK